ncbi:MAG: hypothetical protein QGG73_11410 [Candidatus Hydrogenedentes bacterium]|jgi:hypothetical protein|nr:hypothetical protein [Candidatus Hydrogenedentota bacterium]
MPDQTYMLTQKIWRTIGVASLALAGIMSIHAVRSGFLAQTIRYLIHLVDGEAVRAPSSSVLVHFIYWALFLFLILTALYMALIDLRYIRLQYIVEKRDIFGRTLGDKEFRKSLIEKNEDS